MTDATSEAVTVYSSTVPEFIPGFSGVCVARSLLFCVVLCRSLFDLFSCVYPSLIYSFCICICICIMYVDGSTSAFYFDGVGCAMRLSKNVGEKF